MRNDEKIRLLSILALLFGASCQKTPPANALPVASALAPLPPADVLLDTCPLPKVYHLQAMPAARVVQLAENTGGFPIQISGSTEKTALKPPVLTPAKPPRANFTNFGTEQGLALSIITSGGMDKNGNLWFGTGGGGVSRYDGARFTTFTNKQGLAGNVVSCILPDKNGHLWFGTAEGGASRYDGVTFTTFTTEDGLAHNDVRSIVEDKNGRLWFATRGGGISCYTPDDAEKDRRFTTFTTENGLAHNDVRYMTLDKNGNLWIATRGGISRLNPSRPGDGFKSWTTAEGLVDNDVLSIRVDKNNQIWCGTSKGISRAHIDKNGGVAHFATFTTANGLPLSQVMDIFEDKNGQLWFATGGGVVNYTNGRTDPFFAFTTAQGLAHNVVWNITEDQHSNLWFGTAGGGMSRYNGKSFTAYTTEQGLAHDAVESITEDRHGNLWIGTRGAGVTRFDGKTFMTLSTAQGLGNDEVLNVLEARNGHLWFATDGGGVSRYAPESRRLTTFTTAQGLVNNLVLCVAEDRLGRLWLGTRGGVSCLDNLEQGGRFTNFTTAQGLAHDVVWSITEDTEGHLWFSTRSGGVSRFDGHRFTTYTTAQGLANDVVWSSHKDRSGQLWFGTGGGGASRFDGHGFATFSTEQGLADDVVYDIIEDEQGVLWFGTNQGFSGLKFRDEAASTVKGAGLINLPNAELQQLDPVWEIYNNKTGYPVKDLDFNAMCAAKIGLPFGDNTSKSVIWAGCGDNKVICFDPKSLQKNTNPPAVFIQAIKIKEAPVSWYSLGNVEKDTLTVARQEAMLFGKPLSVQARNAHRAEFAEIAFDGITPGYPLPENLVLPYRHNQVSFEFGAVETSKNFLVRYQHILEGYDREWSPVTEKTSATYGNISEGSYTFKLRACSPEGVWSNPVEYAFAVLPPWWRTWWAYLGYALAVSGAFYSFLQLQIRRSEAKAEARRQLELYDAKNQFLSTVSHELRTPLTSILGFSKIIKKRLEERILPHADLADPKAARAATQVMDNLNIVVSESERLSALINEVLDLAKIESGKFTWHTENVDMAQIIERAVAATATLFKQKGLELRKNIEPGLPEISGDADRLLQVMVNLLSNAVKFTNQGTVTCSARLQDEHTLLIGVADTGIGIPEAFRGLIFEKFQQVTGDALTGRPQGTGLGLAICKEIVEHYGGRIWVESEAGQGSSFFFSLPVIKQTDA